MLHIHPESPSSPIALYNTDETRHIEQTAMASLPPHTLMQRAAGAVFQLGRALYPHARHIWIACGPGNNGGDGLLAAAYWQKHSAHTGTRVTVTWCGKEDRLPEDARYALEQARHAGVNFAEIPPSNPDLCVDALLGLGINTTTHGLLADWAAALQRSQAPVLCVDLPSGLNPDTGEWFNACATQPRGPRHTLALLTLKPGLLTGAGREVTGDLWLDDLGCQTADYPHSARLYAATAPLTPRANRHNTHKGAHGDLLILGGQEFSADGQGMTGAALLAGRAGLLSGAGRVYVGLLGSKAFQSVSVDLGYPELMFRQTQNLMESALLKTATTVCGCGGGMAVREVIAPLLQHSPQLVLDADGLNALAENEAWQEQFQQRRSRGQISVLTPHPLEAARLLKTTTKEIQIDRLAAAKKLANRFNCMVVLKGSGTIVADPEHETTLHGAGNALLATAGTGDVLAGMIGANLCMREFSHQSVFDATNHAVHQHGLVASQWTSAGFSASRLLQGLTPL